MPSPAGPAPPRLPCLAQPRPARPDHAPPCRTSPRHARPALPGPAAPNL